MDAHQLHIQLHWMIREYEQTRNSMPRYILLSQDAIDILTEQHREDFKTEIKGSYMKYMGVDVAKVDVPGIYASPGEFFEPV